MKINGSSIFKTLILSGLSLIFCCCTSKTSNTSGIPSKTEIGGIKIVSLIGTWEEMGEQYGEFAGTELHHVLNFLQNRIAAGANASEMQERADKLISRYPHRFNMFLEGVAKSSGLDLKQLALINASEYDEGFFCSGIAVWGDWAKDGLVYGRNYDAISYADIASDILITVFHPSDGSLPTATIGYAGELYAVNAINSKGIFLELNNGMPSAGYDLLFDRFASTTSLLEVMFDAEDLDYLDAFFKTNRSFSSLIIGVADGSGARSYEWCSTDSKLVESTADGLMVMTNHYVNPEWQYPVPEDDACWNSHTRRNNLISLAEKNKGGIDASLMCEMISTPIEDGGCMFTDGTRYQIVYEPAKMALRIRVEKAPEWAEIDMNTLF